MTTKPSIPPSPFFHPHTPQQQYTHVVVARSAGAAAAAAAAVGQEEHDGDFSRLEITQNEIIPEHKSGLVGCTANLMTCIVGSGIVGIPYAVKQAGFMAGLGLIVLVAVVTEKSLRLLVATAKHIHTPTYETAAEAVFGTTGFKFILANMFIIAFGAMVSYLMIVRDSFSMLLLKKNDDNEISDSFNENLVLLAVSLCIQLPLACLRDMADLDKTSRLAVLIDILLVITVAWVAPWQDNMSNAGGFVQLLRHDTVHYDTIFVGLGVLSFAFECQESAFLVAGSLRQPTLKRWSYVTASALLICATLAVICGVTGYVGYLDVTNGNILNNLSDSVAGNIAHGMLGATMFATYPLASFVARHVCVVLLFEGRRAHEGDDTSILNRTDRRILLTVVLYIAALLPAAFFQDFGFVLALAGVIGGSCLAYIGPGILYLGVHGGRFLDLIQESYWLNPGAAATIRSDQQRRRTHTTGTNGTSTTTTATATAAIDSDINRGQQRRPVTTAVETTPLVATPQQADEILTSQRGDAERQRLNRQTIVGCIKTFVYYILGFPIWCKIAAVGKKNLTIHVHQLVSKSRHPIRIGDVQYSIVQILPDGSVDADPEDSTVLLHTDYMRQHSAPMQGNKTQQAVVEVPVMNDNHTGNGKEEGTTLLQLTTKPTTTTPRGMMKTASNRLQSSLGSSDGLLEPDPQEQPECLDFAIAIFYIVFGFVALFAGLFSLTMPADR